MSAPTPNDMPQAAPEAPVDDTPPPPAEPPSAPPSFTSDDDFNAEKARELIKNLRTVEREYQKYKKEVAPILAEREQKRQSDQTELERAAETAAKLAAGEAHWRAEAVRSKAEALAAGRFVDAETALALIGDLNEYATDDGIDTTKLMARLDKLAEDKPFLVPQRAPEGFLPNRAQGQSGHGPLTAAQRAAHAESQQDWSASLAAKTQQLMDAHNRV